MAGWLRSVNRLPARFLGNKIAIHCIATIPAPSMKPITTSFRLPPELRQRLEETARRLGRGKNWIVVRALEEYLAKGDDRAFVEEARHQSLRASGVVTPDEAFWEDAAEISDGPR